MQIAAMQSRLLRAIACRIARSSLRSWTVDASTLNPFGSPPRALAQASGVRRRRTTDGLFRRHLVRGGDAARLHHDLDRVLDPILGVADRSRQILEREGVSVNLG